ncbi:tumor necrosis factor receptor superfamily member 10B-like isoform X1 [Cyprinodon tularosa]|uniref:tumor necrosis factor receptor superfamily member 10B-like isoform X1 n=1 Tax=Cyprinodon tularosa TaxID=77115 RepID=UPI0018E1E911|nr:tumor necrosis factor receptor superfamily member 10B-like isoform X1 [Cyprinodon tularosa]
MGGRMEALVWWTLVAVLQVGAAHPHRGARAGRSAACREDTEYLHSNICCLKCEAGQFVKSHCTQAGQKGSCEKCEDGTFTEHANGLKQCIKCTQCPPDQEMLRACTPTQDTVCQCKPGRYCHPDEACEICKKCRSCKGDEEVVKNCTSTSDTECKKIQPRSTADEALTKMAVGLGVSAGIILVVLASIFIWKKKRGTAESSSVKPKCFPVTPEPSTAGGHGKGLVADKLQLHVKEEKEKLLNSENSSASSSRHSLTDRREDESFPILDPVDGVESLKKCIEFFEEVNVDFHKRFFRQLSLNDNMIKSRDYLPYEDKIHELLNHWVEKEGKDASLNELLRVLLDLNQRRTAERIVQRAVSGGHYRHQAAALEV